MKVLLIHNNYAVVSGEEIMFQQIAGLFAPTVCYSGMVVKGFVLDDIPVLCSFCTGFNFRTGTVDVVGRSTRKNLIPVSFDRNVISFASAG
jgi:hypothetical protein